MSLCSFGHICCRIWRVKCRPETLPQLQDLYILLLKPESGSYTLNQRLFSLLQISVRNISCCVYGEDKLDCGRKWPWPTWRYYLNIWPEYLFESLDKPHGFGVSAFYSVHFIYKILTKWDRHLELGCLYSGTWSCVASTRGSRHSTYRGSFILKRFGIRKEMHLNLWRGITSQKIGFNADTSVKNTKPATYNSCATPY
jgi:hypothetical protein